MNRFICIIVILILGSCNDHANPDAYDTLAQDSALAEILNEKDTVSWSCEFVYDTITNPDYNMHLLIMQRYTDPRMRGYWFSANGDTMDTYLYPQDIHVWLSKLDTSEQGIYRALTNKIVFLILANDAAHLVVRGIDDSRLRYFIWHVQHPMCNEVPFEQLERRVDSTMQDPEVWEGSLKQKILSQIATQ